MGFHALLAREDYYNILQNTLCEYYTKKTGHTVYVGYVKKKDAVEMIMNPKLGMIFQNHPTKRIRNYFYNAYNIRNNILKNLAAKVFVFISTHTGIVFNLPERLYIYPANCVNKDVVFSYLNRSIRIFDFEKKTTVSIQKESFSSKYFQNQLQFRINHRYEFIPEILSYGDNWFEERILSGISLARVTNVTKYEKGLQDALTSMSILSNNTKKDIDIQVYVHLLSDKVQSLLVDAHNKKKINTYEFASFYSKMLLSTLAETTGYISIGETHGDLQAGNIWIEGDKAWIIDWETHGIRSLWFDAATIKYGTRYEGGIKAMIDNLGETLERELKNNIKCNLNIKDMVSVFLLEDMLFYLEDMMELPNESGKDSFDKYMNEMMKIDCARLQLL